MTASMAGQPGAACWCCHCCAHPRLLMLSVTWALTPSLMPSCPTKVRGMLVTSQSHAIYSLLLLSVVPLRGHRSVSYVSISSCPLQFPLSHKLQACPSSSSCSQYIHHFYPTYAQTITRASHCTYSFLILHAVKPLLTHVLLTLWYQIPMLCSVKFLLRSSGPSGIPRSHRSHVMTISLNDTWIASTAQKR